MSGFLPLLFVLAVVALLLDDAAAVTLFYLLAGAYIAARAWSRRSLRQAALERLAPTHAFPGEEVKVRLRLVNAGPLPLLWLKLADSLPPELGAGHAFQDVVSLRPRGRIELAYHLQASKRGYYPVGPLRLETGDLLGLDDGQRREHPAQHLTVYPRLIPLAHLGLPTHAPLGALPLRQPIYADPARPAGTRPYQPGDSLRRVDWKTTAITGRLQVKLLEPSTALEAALALDFDLEAYPLPGRYDAMELAVVTAASLAHYLSGRRQAVGLFTNGQDAATHTPAGPLPPRAGRAHLMHVLGALGRVQAVPGATPLRRWLPPVLAGLPWGSTLVVITGRARPDLLDLLLPAVRIGLHPVLILTQPGRTAGEDWLGHAPRLGVRVHIVERERDLDAWR